MYTCMIELILNTQVVVRNKTITFRANGNEILMLFGITYRHHVFMIAIVCTVAMFIEASFSYSTAKTLKKDNHSM